MRAALISITSVIATEVTIAVITKRAVIRISVYRLIVGIGTGAGGLVGTAFGAGGSAAYTFKIKWKKCGYFRVMFDKKAVMILRVTAFSFLHTILFARNRYSVL